MRINTIILVVIAFFSCESESQNESINRLIEVPAQSMGELELSKMFNRVDYTLFESSDESLIGEITTVKQAEDRLFVFDREITETLYIFKNSGSYIFKITTGPGAENEPSSITDFAVDAERRLIYIGDRDRQRIMIYDWSGQFVKSFRVGSYFNALEHLYGTKLILYRHNYFTNGDQFNNNRLLLIDSNSEEIKGLLPLEREVRKVFSKGLYQGGAFFSGYGSASRGGEFVVGHVLYGFSSIWIKVKILMMYCNYL